MDFRRPPDEAEASERIDENPALAVAQGRIFRFASRRPSVALLFVPYQLVDSVDELSRMTGLSNSHFRPLFKKRQVLGNPIAEIVDFVKAQQAETMPTFGEDGMSGHMAELPILLYLRVSIMEMDRVYEQDRICNTNWRLWFSSVR